MRILITGATGYIGGRLVTPLVEAGHAVRCLTRDAKRVVGRFDPSVEIVEGDVADERALDEALRGCDAAYYMVHSMGSTKSFAEADRAAALAFSTAARRQGVKRILYLGGLGAGGDSLSTHLRSRQEVGEILRSSGVQTLEFRAAQIIGSGSISFEMVRYLTERLPIMIAPRWVVTRCQPIAIDDVLAYLVAGLTIKTAGSKVYEIGGSDVLTYRDMMLRYGKLRGLNPVILIVPFFTPRLSSYWVHLITPIPARMAQPLILGLHNEVVVRDPVALRDFPAIRPMGYDAAVRLAFDRQCRAGSETSWFDAFDIRTLPGDFAGIKEGVLIDRRERDASASATRIALVFSSLGGARGWLTSNWLWRLRGAMDRLVGGVGLRRGRRDARDLRVGDALDFWRVDAYEPGRLLRLRAEMKLPGRAWLQFEAEPNAGGARFRQTAFFEPRGLFGYFYWYAVAPFHELVFGGMARAIVRAAEAGTGNTALAIARRAFEDGKRAK
jgi:uncharacterized protein YbjT (DUF2867 family)